MTDIIEKLEVPVWYWRKDEHTLSPEAYATIYADGVAAFERDGAKAVNPYFRENGCYKTLAEATRSEAFINGWGFAYNEALKNAANPVTLSGWAFCATAADVQGLLKRKGIIVSMPSFTTAIHDGAVGMTVDRKGLSKSNWLCKINYNGGRRDDARAVEKRELKKITEILRREGLIVRNGCSVSPGVGTEDIGPYLWVRKPGV